MRYINLYKSTAFRAVSSTLLVFLYFVDICGRHMLGQFVSLSWCVRSRVIIIEYVRIVIVWKGLA